MGGNTTTSVVEYTNLAPNYVLPASRIPGYVVPGGSGGEGHRARCLAVVVGQATAGRLEAARGKASRGVAVRERVAAVREREVARSSVLSPGLY